jgi:hypothetical protein
LRAPSLQEGNGIATKVTETLIVPPRICLTRSLMVPLALASTNRVAITDMDDRLALMV